MKKQKKKEVVPHRSNGTVGGGGAGRRVAGRRGGGGGRGRRQAAAAAVGWDVVAGRIGEERGREERVTGGGWGQLVSLLFAIRRSLSSAFVSLCRLLAHGKEVGC